MTDEKTDALRDIFMEVSEDGTFTERQAEAPSHDPIGEREADMEAEVSQSARADGLEDAVDADFGGAA
ncbi:hypothetical protein BRC81_04475 [Halobacteriales archaeon QS_1_68_20]|nr:MAG: hypothetical protein BRC81_04475 [Halobacteriales archaeon QS_1_68_20]